MNSILIYVIRHSSDLPLDITHKPDLFKPAVLIGMVNFYDFTPLSVTLTLARGHKVSGKQIC